MTLPAVQRDHIELHIKTPRLAASVMTIDAGPTPIEYEVERVHVGNDWERWTDWTTTKVVEDTDPTMFPVYGPWERVVYRPIERLVPHRFVTLHQERRLVKSWVHPQYGRMGAVMMTEERTLRV